MAFDFILITSAVELDLADGMRSTLVESINAWCAARSASIASQPGCFSLISRTNVAEIPNPVWFASFVKMSRDDLGDQIRNASWKSRESVRALIRFDFSETFIEEELWLCPPDQDETPRAFCTRGGYDWTVKVEAPGVGRVEQAAKAAADVLMSRPAPARKPRAQKPKNPPPQL